MNSQVNFVERRDHPRVGVMAQLENITYSVLRKHGVVSGPGSEAPNAYADHALGGTARRSDNGKPYSHLEQRSTNTSRDDSTHLAAL